MKEERLKNGLLVLFKEEHTLPLISLQLWVKVGSAYENEKNNGITHFLEHMLFKGTKKYGVGEIGHLIESSGGRINAGTGKDFTVFYLNIPKDALPLALEVLAEVCGNATFPQEEVERERLVILEEIKRHDDDPDSVLGDTFNERVYTLTPYHYRVIGTTETIQGMSRETLIEYYQTYYVPNNMSLVIVGDFEMEKILPTLQGLYGSLPTRTLPSPPPLSEPTKEAFQHKERKNVQYAYILAGFLGPTVESSDQYAFDLLAVALGEGRNSRFYKKLREEKKIVWDIGSSFLTQKGTGLFLIVARSTPDKVDSVVKEITEELLDLEKNGLTDKELIRAKTLIESSWLFGNETYSGQAHTYGYAATLKDTEFAENYLKNISAVSKDEIKEVLSTCFPGKKLNLVVFYPE